MEFALGLFTGLGFWPLVVITVVAIALVPLVEFERSGFATLSVIIGLGLLQTAFGFNIVGAILANPIADLLWVGFYILLGVCYSLVRWNAYCYSWRYQYDRATSSYERDSLWARRPEPSNSKNRIMTWMMFWPWSAFWLFLSDFLTNIFEWIYTRFATVYYRIAARHMADIQRPGPQP